MGLFRSLSSTSLSYIGSWLIPVFSLTVWLILHTELVLVLVLVLNQIRPLSCHCYSDTALAVWGGVHPVAQDIARIRSLVPLTEIIKCCTVQQSVGPFQKLCLVCPVAPQEQSLVKKIHRKGINVAHNINIQGLMWPWGVWLCRDIVAWDPSPSGQGCRCLLYTSDAADE